MKVIKVIYVMLKVNSKYNRLICQTRKRTKNGLEQLERMGSNFFSPWEGWDILVRENVYFYEKWVFCFILKTSKFKLNIKTQIKQINKIQSHAER